MDHDIMPLGADHAPAMSAEEFDELDQEIENTLKTAAIDVGRLLLQIEERGGWAWRFPSFKEYLRSRFKTAARGYQFMRYAGLVDEALILIAERSPMLQPDLVRQRLPTERRLRDVMRDHGRGTTVELLANSLICGEPLPPSRSDAHELMLPPPPKPTRTGLKRLGRDQLAAALEALTNVDPNFSRAMVLNIDRPQTLALIQEAIATLSMIQETLLERGGGR